MTGKNYCGYCGKEIFELMEVNDFNGRRIHTYFDDWQHTQKHNCKEKTDRNKEKEFEIWGRTDKEACSIIY